MPRLSLTAARAPRALLALAALFGAVTLPAPALACACGCGVFDVGDNALIPMTADSGVSLFYRFSYMDQDRNREHGHTASADDNDDKRLETSFHTFGAEVRLARNWTVMAELPLYDRRFTTTGTDAVGRDVIETVPLTALGDAIVRVTYTGLAADKSTGLSLGVKLPTGRDTSPTDAYGGQPYDRDSLPGTGSTDLVLGAYHVGAIGGRGLHWFAQAQGQIAVATQAGYRPGDEADGALGLSYALPAAGGVQVSPVLQLIGSLRARDSGVAADPFNTGYRRLLIAPGLRVQLGRRLSLYGDVEFPVAQDVNAAGPGDDADSMGQLVAPVQVKMQIAYAF